MRLAKEATAKLGPAFPPATEGEALPSLEAGAGRRRNRQARAHVAGAGSDRPPAMREEAQEVEQRFAYLAGQSADLATAKGGLEKADWRSWKQPEPRDVQGRSPRSRPSSARTSPSCSAAARPRLVIVAGEEPAEEGAVREAARRLVALAR
ncbi:MAG: hypothetical protein WKG07_13005 [Hymenobacter sp.]